jgi:two-component SAPR family response regulator
LKNERKIEIRCFSRFCLLADGKTINLRSAKAEELFALLACEQGLPISKSRAAEMLWCDIDSKRAANNLYQILHNIKKAAPNVSAAIILTRGAIQLDTSRAMTDTEKFMALYNSPEPKDWVAAINLYRGILLMDNKYDWANEYEAYYDICYYEMQNRLEKYYAEIGNINMSRYYRDKALE